MRNANILVLPERYKNRLNDIPNHVIICLDFFAYQCEDRDEFYVVKNRVQGNFGRYVDGDTVRADIKFIVNDMETKENI